MHHFIPSTMALALLGLVSQLAAQDKFDPAARAAKVAPFVDAQTVVVQHADLTRATPAAAFDLLAQVLPQANEQLEGPRQASEALYSQLVQAGARDIYSVVSLADIPHEPPFVILPLLWWWRARRRHAV